MCYTRLTFVLVYNSDMPFIYNFILQNLEPKHAPHMLLALYQTATLSRGSSLPSAQLLPDVSSVHKAQKVTEVIPPKTVSNRSTLPSQSVQELDKFIKECRLFSEEVCCCYSYVYMTQRIPYNLAEFI